MTTQAKISDIFSSLQGEGPYLGLRQIFIRFAGCNLSCIFCDVLKARYSQAQIFDTQGLIEKVESLREKFGPYHSLSLTGGEPLLQVEFLKEFLSQFKKIKIYLETNGILYKEFKEIYSWVDFISLDFKLPSSTGLKGFWLEHYHFLKLGRNKNPFVKVVITAKTTQKDLKKAIEIIARVNRNIPLILQPVTATSNFCAVPSNEKLLDFQRQALKVLKEVRIIPQLHKIMGLK